MLDIETLRLRIYRGLAEDGLVVSVDALAAELGEPRGAIVDGIRALARDRHLALDAEVGDAGMPEIVLAHPFATRDFGFSVKSTSTLWWGGCAWDAFAIPHLVAGSAPALIATTCPNCGRAHAWSVGRDAPPEGDQVAHFLVPMAHVWDDVIHACGNQRVFCDERCVDGWLARTGEAKGSVFDIPTLWRLASDWYAGRLDRGYRRREPIAAREYFRDAGLTGAFWGL
jgi:hypothetical protein